MSKQRFLFWQPAVKHKTLKSGKEVEMRRNRPTVKGKVGKNFFLFSFSFINNSGENNFFLYPETGDSSVARLPIHIVYYWFISVYATWLHHRLLFTAFLSLSSLVEKETRKTFFLFPFFSSYKICIPKLLHQIMQGVVTI